MEKESKQEALSEKSAEEKEFDQELARLMTPDPDGNSKKKKKKDQRKRKWSKKTIVFLAVGIAVIGFAGWKVKFGKKEAVPPFVSAMELAPGTVQNRLTITGPISGTDSVDVVSNLHAEVLELKVKEGDRVEKDQVLAVIDNKDIMKEIEVAQNAYDLAVASRQQRQRELQNGYAKALQDLQVARAALDRTAVMVEAGSEPPVNLENAQNTYADAQRELSTYRLSGGKPSPDESYDLQIKNAAFELERKKEALEDAQVKSPIAGTVTRVNTKVGQFADKPEDDRPMFIIENLEQLELEIKVSEYSIGKVKVGQPVSIRADILNGESVEGVVASISPTGEEKGGGSSERVIPTTVKILDNESGLIAGITARAEIILEEAQNALVIPASALLQKEDGSLWVQKVENNVIHEVAVTTGVEGDVSLEVKPVEEGSLSFGDQIVIAATSVLTDGMTVNAQSLGGNQQ